MHIFFASDDVNVTCFYKFADNKIIMPFSVEDRHTIKVLRESHQYGATRLMKMFPNKQWTLGGLKTLILKTDRCGTVERCCGSGRLHSARCDDNIDDVTSVISFSVRKGKIANVEELRQRIVDEWERFDQCIIDGAVKECQKRLRVCSAAEGGQFEHELCLLVQQCCCNFAV